MKINILSKIIAGALVTGGGVAAITIAAVKSNKSEDDGQNERSTPEAQQNDSVKAIVNDTKLTTGGGNESGISTTQIQNTENKQKDSNSEISSVSTTPAQDFVGQVQGSSVTDATSTDSNNQATSSVATDSIQVNQEKNVEVVQNNTGSTESTNAELSTNSDQESQKNQDISLFVVSKSFSFNQSTDNFENNYQCKFASKEAFDCTITLANIDEASKHSNINKFTQDNSAETTITKESLKTQGKFYKVTMTNRTDESKIDWANDDDYISDMYLTSKTNNNEKFAQLIVLFVMDGKKAHEKNKITDFVFKSTEESTEKNINNTQLKCSYTNVAENNCSVYNFSSENQQQRLETLNLQKKDNSLDLVSIEKDKYYWIQWSSTKNKINSVNNIQIKHQDNNVGTYVVTPAVFYQTSDESQWHLFVLSSETL